jgi:hypothetical protein
MSYRTQPSSRARFATKEAATAVMSAMQAAGKIAAWNMHQGFGGVTVRARRDASWFDVNKYTIADFLGADVAA